MLSAQEFNQTGWVVHEVKYVLTAGFTRSPARVKVNLKSLKVEVAN